MSKPLCCNSIQKVLGAAHSHDRTTAASAVASFLKIQKLLLLLLSLNMDTTAKMIEQRKDLQNLNSNATCSGAHNTQQS